MKPKKLTKREKQILTEFIKGLNLFELAIEHDDCIGGGSFWLLMFESYCDEWGI